MRTWVFNNGSYKHRGVWHVAEGELLKRLVEETTRDYESTVRAYHEKSCSGEQKYVYDGNYDSAGFSSRVTYRAGRYKWVGCDCSLNTEDANVKIGTYTVRTITPAHFEIKRQPVLCHHVEIHDTELGKWPNHKQAGVGGLVVVRIEKKPLNVWKGERPPGPVCSRCLNKAERDDI